MIRVIIDRPIRVALGTWQPEGVDDGGRYCGRPRQRSYLERLLEALSCSPLLDA
jgi:hypothetical protein